MCEQHADDVSIALLNSIMKRGIAALQISTENKNERNRVREYIMGSQSGKMGLKYTHRKRKHDCIDITTEGNGTILRIPRACKTPRQNRNYVNLSASCYACIMLHSENTAHIIDQRTLSFALTSTS